MTILDIQKLTRLRRDVGDRTSFVRELIASFEVDVVAVRDAQDAPLPERADVVHRVTGSAAMLAPMGTVVRLNSLENVLREGDPSSVEFWAVTEVLEATIQALMSWIECAPPDGEPIITSL